MDIPITLRTAPAGSASTASGTGNGAGADGVASAKTVLVLRKARQILDAFSPATPELTAREVQRATSLPASTCLRLLQTLVAEGFLDRRGERYRPGVALLRWAQTATVGLDLVGTALPVLRALRDATGESACLYLRDGAQHTCVAVVETPHAVVHILRVGQILPLHAGSAGRVFLAFDDPSVLDRLGEAPLPTLTAHTITDPVALRAAVQWTRREGYAVTFEERSIGAASLSAPVFDSTGALAAVVGIVVPVQRFGPDRAPVLQPHVADAGAQLSRRLGRRTSSTTTSAGGE